MIGGIGMPELIVISIIGIPAVALYCLPSIIAHIKGHRYKGLIITLNILAGWTFLGWVACFIWSFINPQPQIARRH